MAEGNNRGSLTSWIVIGLGVIVAAVGWLFVTGLLGAGLIGFGLAHIVLGIIDLFRPTVKT
ncbi:MAG: hypothetical protein IBX71_08165 [Candidatus Desulforudis sp.]|nr:hypothetical protein [Desulforudis sp.]